MHVSSPTFSYNSDYDQDPSFDDSWAWEFGGWTKPAIKQFWDHGPNCGPDVDQNYYP